MPRQRPSAPHSTAQLIVPSVRFYVWNLISTHEYYNLSLFSEAVSLHRNMCVKMTRVNVIAAFVKYFFLVYCCLCSKLFYLSINYENGIYFNSKMASAFNSKMASASTSKMASIFKFQDGGHLM